MSNNWESGTWTRPPRAEQVTSDGLRVEAAKGSDFWQRTLYGFQHDNGHALLAPTGLTQAIEVSFDLACLTHLYDQAGLLIRASAERWIKAGVEISDGLPHVGVVVTHGLSDWSLAPVPHWRGVVTIRCSPLGGAAVFRARINHDNWHTIRVAPLPLDATLEAGPMLCAPTRAGLTVTFREWREVPADVDLHTDPPS